MTSAHTAFGNLTSAIDAAHREGIELRTLVLYWARLKQLNSRRNDSIFAIVSEAIVLLLSY